METYFVRHTLGCSVDEITRERMWRENRIFVHFPWDKSGSKTSDSKSVNPTDYAGFRKGGISALNRLATEGGFVAAHYIGHDNWLVGKISPNTPVKICEGKWRPEELEKNPDLKNHDGIVILKTLKLSECQQIAPANYALLQAVQPRQGTIMRWHKAGGLVEAIVTGQKPKISFDLLSPPHQETLCAEFLRRPITSQFGLPQLDCVLCDVGRSMKDLDIFGLAIDGGKIFAQVTHDVLKKAGHKIAALKKYQESNRDHLILFCDHDKAEIRDTVKIVPIKEVFKAFTASQSGKRWLQGIFPQV